jgi:hypothetical protein
MAGHTQTLDSAPVKAKTSLEDPCEKQTADAPAPPLHVAGEPVPDVGAAPLAPA